jgi:GNAT superfamily N-acetyltransferase
LIKQCTLRNQAEETALSLNYSKEIRGDWPRLGKNIIAFTMKPGHYNLGRIYIDPDYQNKGIGAQTMKFIESAFRDSQKWTLGTPKLAFRNHHFYEKLGYVRIGDDGPDGYIYEKNMS